MKKNVWRLCILAVLVSVAFITVYPLIYIFLASFKSNIEILTNSSSIFPQELTFENYISVCRSNDFNIFRMLWNSIYYTLISVAIAITISSMAGYAFARGEFPFKKTIFAMFTALMFITTGGLDIYPKFKILTALHLNRSLGALLFLKLFGVPIVNIYLVRGFVQSLPIELDEAAQIDGCSFIGAFFKIIMPLLAPILATIGILSFQASWNDYIMPTIFTATQPKQYTLIVGLMSLKNSGSAAANWNLILAGTVITLLPVLVAYGFGNRYFVSGLAAGAIKG